MIDKEVARLFDRRSALFLTAGAVLTSALVMRMLQMQLFNYKEYTKKSENNSFRVQINMPERGKILSESGTPISRDAQIYRIYIIPEESKNLEETINTVAKELKLKPKRVDRIFAQIKKQAGFQPVLISENSNWSELAKLQAKNIPGLHVRNGFTRVYEMGPAGAQIFGYVGAPSEPVPNAPFMTTGITGLEKRFNEELTGTPGQTVMITNAVGRVTGEDKSQFKTAVTGKDLLTTINYEAQQAMYDALMQHRAGCGVALDINTGDILAMVSTPSFDPNMFSADDGDEYIDSLRKDNMKPFMNKTIEGLYPPGSTFKIVVALAALEAGAITPNEKIFCPGHWDYGDRRYHCWEAKGHGWVNLADALKHSCDIYFYQLALRIGIDSIKDMAIKLGFTQKYMDGILSREMAGIIPDRYWKEEAIGYRWMHGDTIISGIGQGFTLTNCLQLAIMMARTASNKVVMPRLILTDEKPKFANLGLQKKNIKAVLTGLEEVTKKGGTAAGSAINVNGARMGGKTGTSQVRSISRAERESGVLTNEQLKWNMRNHGLFVGYAPTNNPKYAICAITEHSGGSGSAARTVAATMKVLLKEKK
ncbi:MAG TPA: penicillin-binding protein 2 [Candidatus Enterousia avicola]|uniref:Beta-lactamase n=1 Tax=Candidatus Enterousia avicola TaxID=2840787 RepID=A0A9D1MSE6_9PROT|nr:penicillin-binding protein 2 [Candidatus Enterousia avicola]